MSSGAGGDPGWDCGGVGGCRTSPPASDHGERGDRMGLSEIVPWGRSFEEYRRTFSLTSSDLAGRILGCGDGPASFNAEATTAGHSIVSCDPIYASAAEEIERRVEETYDTVISQVKLHPERFVWDFF